MMTFTRHPNDKHASKLLSWCVRSERHAVAQIIVLLVATRTLAIDGVDAAETAGRDGEWHW